MNRSFTVVCNNCGNEVLISGGLTDYESEPEKVPQISLTATCGETAELVCSCGNMVERY